MTELIKKAVAEPAADETTNDNAAPTPPDEAVEDTTSDDRVNDSAGPEEAPVEAEKTAAPRAQRGTTRVVYSVALLAVREPGDMTPNAEGVSSDIDGVRFVSILHYTTAFEAAATAFLATRAAIDNGTEESIVIIVNVEAEGIGSREKIVAISDLVGSGDPEEGLTAQAVMARRTKASARVIGSRAKGDALAQVIARVSAVGYEVLADVEQSMYNRVVMYRAEQGLGVLAAIAQQSGANVFGGGSYSQASTTPPQQEEAAPQTQPEAQDEGVNDDASTTNITMDADAATECVEGQPQEPAAEEEGAGYTNVSAGVYSGRGEPPNTPEPSAVSVTAEEPYESIPKDLLADTTEEAPPILAAAEPHPAPAPRAPTAVLDFDGVPPRRTVPVFDSEPRKPFVPHTIPDHIVSAIADAASGKGAMAPALDDPTDSVLQALRAGPPVNA